MKLFVLLSIPLSLIYAFQAQKTLSVDASPLPGESQEEYVARLRKNPKLRVFESGNQITIYEIDDNKTAKQNSLTSLKDYVGQNNMVEVRRKVFWANVDELPKVPPQVFQMFDARASDIMGDGNVKNTFDTPLTQWDEVKNEDAAQEEHGQDHDATDKPNTNDEAKPEGENTEEAQDGEIKPENTEKPGLNDASQLHRKSKFY